MAAVSFLRLLSVVCLLNFSFGYLPNWDSLDSRPLPEWFDQSKIGIFIHWGVFSVPSFSGAYMWYAWKGFKTPAIVKFMSENYPPDFTYPDFAAQFTAEFYDPDKWAKIFKASGAKYVVLVTKHHEGYTNWPSSYSWNWNSMDVGPKRDLTGDLAVAVRKQKDMKFGVYHSLFEFYNPLYLQDKANNYTTQEFVKTKTLPELYELVNKYHPELIWSDGAWEVDDFYWNSTDFLAWLYNSSPVKDSVVVNDRWGKNTPCKHGGYWNCKDKYNPRVLQKHKWENCMTLDLGSWGYRRPATYEDIISIEALIKTLAETISCGGNLLINVGPTHDGRIIPIFEERLRQLGSWLDLNGEAIYSSVPWTYQNDTLTSDVWYTSKKAANQTVVYAIVLNWPKNDLLILGSPLVTSATQVDLIGYTAELSWRALPEVETGMMITIPPVSVNTVTCKWAWVFRLTGLGN
ncbi:alpha-L-fucosidase-like [Argopecten irradians]|uniref:alpha-L-fucosidase-like n=1 Tax=Argopecten irradians TaxID=31199 RepID=UPI00371CE882